MKITTIVDGTNKFHKYEKTFRLTINGKNIWNPIKEEIESKQGNGATRNKNKRKIILRKRIIYLSRAHFSSSSSLYTISFQSCFLGYKCGWYIYYIYFTDVFDFAFIWYTTTHTNHLIFFEEDFLNYKNKNKNK